GGRGRGGEAGRDNGMWVGGRRRGFVHLVAGGGDLGGKPPFQRGFGGKRDQRQQRQQRGDSEGGDEVVLVVEDLDMQRHGVGLATNVAGNNGDSTELAHRPRIAQQHAVEQAPADVG